MSRPKNVNFCLFNFIFVWSLSALLCLLLYMYTNFVHLTYISGFYFCFVNSFRNNALRHMFLDHSGLKWSSQAILLIHDKDTWRRIWGASTWGYQSVGVIHVRSPITWTHCLKKVAFYSKILAARIPVANVISQFWPDLIVTVRM